MQPRRPSALISRDGGKVRRKTEVHECLARYRLFAGSAGYIRVAGSHPGRGGGLDDTDKLCHSIAYFCLTFWFSQIYRQSRTRWPSPLFRNDGGRPEMPRDLPIIAASSTQTWRRTQAGSRAAWQPSQTRLARAFAAVERCISRIFRIVLT